VSFRQASAPQQVPAVPASIITILNIASRAVHGPHLETARRVTPILPIIQTLLDTIISVAQSLTVVTTPPFRRAM
jgi:hypothetical protein